MTLSQRAQQQQQAGEVRSRASGGGTAVQEAGKVGPIYLGPRDLFAVVDGEILNVLGTTDIQGMSPAYWCSDNEGVSAGVPVREAPIFTSAQQALAFLETSRGSRTSR